LPTDHKQETLVITMIGRPSSLKTDGIEEGRIHCTEGCDDLAN